MYDEQPAMYDLEFPSPEITNPAPDGPTLVIALDGYADAGHAVGGSADHLLAALEHRPIATFNVDELIDFRSRRPGVTISDSEIIDVESLELSMDVVRDSRGQSFLLLSGPEPDLRWGAFSQAVAELAQKFNVDKVIALYGVPMAVPHTRPTVVSGHSNSPELIQRVVNWDGRFQVPGSASLNLEKTLADRGHRVAGYSVQVPHYITQSPYPRAMLKLLQTVEVNAQLRFPLGTLEADTVRIDEQLAEQTEASREIQQVVHALEEQFDQEAQRHRERNPQGILPGEENLPTGEEISAEFEQFLAAIDATGLPGPSHQVSHDPHSTEGDHHNQDVGRHGESDEDSASEEQPGE